MVAEAKITRRPRERLIEAEWQTGPDRFVVLSVRHSAHSRALIASLRRERSETLGGIESRCYAPFQDLQRIDAVRIPRYSAKALEAFWEKALAHVELYRGDPENLVGEWFASGTTV